MPLDQTIALQAKPPNMLDTLGKLSQIQNLQAETARREYDLRSQEIARAANEVAQTPEGSPQRLEMWNHHVDDLHKKGFLNNVERSQWYNNPSTLVLNQAIARGTPVETQMQMTGVTAGQQAAREAPYKPMAIRPGERIVYPGMMPGAPMAPSGAGQVPGTPAVPGQPMSIVPIPGAPARTTAAPAKPGTSKLPYYDDIPANPVAPQPGEGPGVVEQGTHPLAEQSAAAGIKELQEDIAPKVESASQTRASLGTMISALQSGKVNTNRLAELRLEIAGFINGVLQEKDGKTASAIAGINMPWAEALNKETTRMGLSYARQTEGAREAVQAIMIALKANPSLLNSVEGNLKIAKIMRAAADYDIERGTAANSYFRKQQDSAGTGHLVGFEQWWNTKNSPAAFISKVIPYQIPETPQDLRPGITYEWPKMGADGKPTISPKTKQPVMQRGTYDPDRGGFVHVK